MDGLLRIGWIAVILIGFGPSAWGIDLFVSPDGADTQAGTADAPLLSVQTAINCAAAVVKQSGYPSDGIRITIRSGHYSFDKPLTIPPLCQGTLENPFVIAGDVQQPPVFSGGHLLGLGLARLVKHESVLARLHAQARDRVFVEAVTSPDLRALLSQHQAKVSYKGRMMNLARYPNVGYGHMDRILDQGAIYAHGRTMGDPPKYSMEHPIGGIFTLTYKSTESWEREFQRKKKARVVGYLAYDWYKQNHRIARIQNGTIQLLEYSRYGLDKKKEIPRRLVVKNLLCELDEPGEFYFDESVGLLYFWPYDDRLDAEGLSLWASFPFAELNNLSHVSLENLVIEGVSQGKAAVSIQNCHNVRLAGCTIRNCSRPAVNIQGGTRCGLLSCDLYDVPLHLTLDGGDTMNLIPSAHYAMNCHFTQVQATDYYGKIQIRGVGQVFQNNLVHNFIGQVMTLGGNDHLVEYNEFFNIGIEEGDGGTIYSGAQMWSWGNVYRYNFLHHLMCVPKAHPRGGIYPDDRDQGDTIVNNLFYKAAHRAVLINGGAGHTVKGNCFLQGHIGIYNTESGSEKICQDQARYDAGELKRGDKTDYIWRTEQAIGPEGWNQEPWASRYPLFRMIMNQERKRFWPIECDFSNNCFSGNFRDIEYRFASGEQGVKDISEVPHIRAENNRTISMTVFRDPNAMDFRYRTRRNDRDLPDIHFEDIGLFQDRFRPNPPDKQAYRQAVQRRFAQRKSYDPDARYDPQSINDLIYFNTGKLLWQD